MKIVSFSRVVPYEGIPHAGGAYYLAHLRRLLTKHDVTVLAPNTVRNRAALKDYDLSARVILVGATTSTGLTKWALKVLGELRPASSPIEVSQAVRADKQIRSILRNADVIEFQWSENASLVRQVSRINRASRKIVIMHDVLQQKYQRRLRSEAGFKKRIRALLAYLSAVILEPNRLRRCDAVIVFSEKDKDLLAVAKTLAPIIVVPPPLTAGDTSCVHPRVPYRVLFTGAMDRPENDQGIRWFIQECWPRIKSFHPSATLIIAGSSPTEKLFQLASQDNSISVTGYVPDLEPYYVESSLFVVPLFQGAGVKFKTISAMLHGLPVVSTTVGAEGVGPDRLFGAIADDASHFSAAVSRLLTDSVLWEEVSEKSSQWASQAYGLKRFHQALDEALDYATADLRSQF